MTKKPKQTEDKFAPGHHVGQFYGYTVKVNGDIELAPGFTDRFASIVDREQGMNELLKSVNSFAAEFFRQTTEQKRKWFDDVADDLGIDLRADGGWSFNGRVLSKIKPPEDKP